MGKDPVCGMEVEEQKAGASTVYKGIRYGFCGAACKVAFEENPEKFIGKAGGHGGHWTDRR